MREAYAGATLTVPITVIDNGDHVDPDGNTVSAVLNTHPAVVPTITRLSQGNYTATFTGLDPELTEGQTVFVSVDGAIGGDAWTTYAIPILIRALERGDITPTSDTPTLDEIASNPARVRVGSEEVQEHALRDQIEYQRYKDQREGQSSTPTEGKFGLPIFRTRVRNGRP